jgi:hypothetical protein
MLDRFCRRVGTFAVDIRVAFVLVCRLRTEARKMVGWFGARNNAHLLLFLVAGANTL